MNYRVKLAYIYSDVVHVEAENKEDALEKAMIEAHEEFEYFYDAKVEEEE